MQKNIVTRYLTAPALAVVLAAAPIFAQSKPLLRAVYLQGGAGRATLTESANYPTVTMGSVPSFTASLGIEMRATERLNVALEGGSENRGSILTDNGYGSVRLRTAFWQASVLGRLNLSPRAGFQISPQAGLERGMITLHDFVDNEKGVILGQAPTNSRETNALIGARINHARLRRWSLDLRYKYALTESSAAANEDFRNRSWIVQLRFDFLHR